MDPRMGSPHAEDARRSPLPRRNLAVGEESAGQIGDWPILTLALRGRGGREAVMVVRFREAVGFHHCFANYFILHNR